MPSSVYPQSLTRQPHGACGFAIARRRLRCFDFLPEVSLTLLRGPDGPFQFYVFINTFYNIYPEFDIFHDSDRYLVKIMIFYFSRAVLRS